MAASAGLLCVLIGHIARPGNGGQAPLLRPRPASAQPVQATGAQATALLQTLRGEVSIECAEPFLDCAPKSTGRGQLRWSFVITARGDERLSGIGHLDEISYSAERRELRTFSPSRHPQATEVVGIPAGPPDFMAGWSPLRREYGSLLRALQAAGVPVAEVSQEGRSAWRLAVPVQPNKLAGPQRSGDRLDLTIDRQTGLPLRIEETQSGRFLHAITVSGLKVNEPVDMARFLLEFPVGVHPFVQDLGFRAVELEEVAAAVGYAPLLPRELPAGFVRAEVTVARTSPGTGKEGMNPPGRGVVSVAYRRGLDRIVVSTRLVGPSPGAWQDPLATSEGNFDVPQQLVLSRGALVGARAELVMSPRGTPHLWALGRRLVVTIAGDASADELRRTVESFQEVVPGACR